MKGLPEVLCVYCGAKGRTYVDEAWHPYVQNYGPFHIFLCTGCHSMFTSPLPSREDLRSLYQGFRKGMFQNISVLRELFPMTAWYRQCMEHMMRKAGSLGDELTWMDIGAGGGEMSALMMRNYPGSRGVAVDMHERPGEIADLKVDWVMRDLGAGLAGLPQAQLIFSITVLEHLPDPRKFLGDALGLLDKGGVLYLNCPAADSYVFKLLGTKWPYFLPGEHLSVPTRKGLRALMEDLAGGAGEKKFDIDIKPVTMPYPVGYYVGYFTGNRWLPRLQFPVWLPTGLLECTVRRLD